MEDKIVPTLNQVYNNKLTIVEAVRQINDLLIEELSHVEPNARWFPNEDLYGAIKVSERLAELKAKQGADKVPVFRICYEEPIGTFVSYREDTMQDMPKQLGADND